jgi:hypothetical protein
LLLDLPYNRQEIGNVETYNIYIFIVYG